MTSRFSQKSRVWTLLLLATAANAWAQTNPPASLQTCAADKATSGKPAWLTEASITVRGGYDNNVYASGCDGRFDPATYRGPIPGSVTATKNHGVFFEELTPKIAMDFAKMQGGQMEDNVVQKLTFSYAPDFFDYNGAPSEDYVAHRLASTVALKCNEWSFLLDEAFADIEGSKYAETFPGKYYSSWGHGIDRERRSQLQDRTAVALTYDQDSWFFRPTGSLLGYDLHTVKSNAPTSNAGYLNYVDRYDINGGADVGYKLDKELAVTLGYRVGKQYQQREPFAIDPFGQTSDSDYQRILLGIEGKITSWLSGKIQAGPDFRVYDDSAPVRRRDVIKYYGEGTLTAKVSKDDSIVFAYRQWEWVSSSGLVPIYDSRFDLSYKHQFTDQLAGKLGFCVQSSDYDSGESWSAANNDYRTAMHNYRNDWLYTPSAGVQYALTANINVDLAYSVMLGRNAQGDADLLQATGSQLPASKREFDDQIVSLGVQYKF